MNECCAVLTKAHGIPETDADLIGVDRGALILAEAGKRMKLALGDFDSVAEGDLDLIRRMSDETVILNPVKDDSDSEAAVTELIRRGYARITLTGGTGGRLDHEIVNLRLVSMFPGILVLKNEKNTVQAFSEGVHHIGTEGRKYISFFAAVPSVISLSGMKYPLDHRIFMPQDLYGLSNEITGEEGILTVHSGIVLCVQSDD